MGRNSAASSSSRSLGPRVRLTKEKPVKKVETSKSDIAHDETTHTPSTKQTLGTDKSSIAHNEVAHTPSTKQVESDPIKKTTDSAPTKKTSDPSETNPDNTLGNGNNNNNSPTIKDRLKNAAPDLLMTGVSTAPMLAMSFG